MNTIFTLALVISAAVFLLAPWLTRNIVAPGFDAATTQITADMMRILLLSTIIFAVSGIFSGILNSHQHFLLPALAPIVFDLGILFGVMFLMPRLGVHGIAWGAVIGSALHAGVQVPGLLRYKMRWRAQLGLRNRQLWRVIWLMLPRVGGLGVFSLNFLVMNNIASRLGSGSVSALDWGWRLMQIPQTLIGTAMGIVIFPTLAALSEMDDLAGKRGAMSGALRFILVASIPSAIGLITLGRPLISLLERGAFDSSASALVYSTLSMFTLGLVVHSALEIIARSFYADKDTLTPLFAALGGAAINLAAAIALSDVQAIDAAGFHNALVDSMPWLGLRRETGNVSGLALANSLGVMFEVLCLLAILRRRWQGAHESELARTLLKNAAGIVDHGGGHRGGRCAVAGGAAHGRTCHDNRAAGGGRAVGRCCVRACGCRAQDAGSRGAAEYAAQRITNGLVGATCQVARNTFCGQSGRPARPPLRLISNRAN